MSDIKVLSELVSRALLASQVGKQFGTDRDVYEALGYDKSITYDMYAARYSRQDIARAIINRPISYTWKGKVLISEAGDDNETALEKQWKELEARLKLKSKFVRLDKLSSIGNYGALLLGFDDVKDNGGWKEPANSKKLLYVKPLGEGHATIRSYVKNTKDPRFGMVETYNVVITNPSDPSRTTGSSQTIEAHHTRVIHVVPELMESEIEGQPVMMSVWNRLMDLEKLVGGSAEMFWKGARPGYQGLLDEDTDLTTDEENKLQDQIDEFEHKLRRMIIAKGLKWEALAPQVADPTAHVDIQIQMISAITGIPKRILTGSERGELSSQQDLTSWYSLIQTRREEHAEANIIRPFVDRMIEYGILPEPSTGEYQVQWEDLFSTSDKDQAEVGRIRASALKEYVSSMATEVVPVEAFIEFFSGLNEDEKELMLEQIKQARANAIKQDNDPEPEPDPEPPDPQNNE